MLSARRGQLMLELTWEPLPETACGVAVSPLTPEGAWSLAAVLLRLLSRQARVPQGRAALCKMALWPSANVAAGPLQIVCWVAVVAPGCEAPAAAAALDAFGP